MAGGVFGREQPVLGNAALKGFGERSVHGSGVQADAKRLLAVARHLYGQTADRHVERCLGRAVAVPATQPVVADAADPGGEGGEDRLAVAGQQRQEVPGDQSRADGVDLKGAGQRLACQHAIAFLRLQIGAVMQNSAGDDDQIEGAVLACAFGGCRDGGLVIVVETAGGDLGSAGKGAARKGVDLRDRGIGSQVPDEGTPDTARGADDGGSQRRGETLQSGHFIVSRAGRAWGGLGNRPGKAIL